MRADTASPIAIPVLVCSNRQPEQGARAHLSAPGAQPIYWQALNKVHHFDPMMQPTRVSRAMSLTQRAQRR